MRKYPSVIQEGSSDCGACSLLMIIRSYGGDYSLEKLRDLTRTNVDGTTAYHIVLAAKSLGFSAWTVTGKVSDLESDLFPCIAHVVDEKGYAHFIVIHKMIGKRLIVSDPAIGQKTIMVSDFEKISTGNYILFSLDKVLAKLNKQSFMAKELISFAVKHKKTIIIMLIISIIYTILNIFLSYKLKLIIDHVIKYYSYDNLMLITLVVLLLSLLKVISDSARFHLLNYLKHELDFHISKRAYIQIIKLPYLYYKNRSSGEIISRLQDLSDIKELLSQLILGLLIDFLLAGFAFLALWQISSYLTILIAITTLLLILISLLFRPIIFYHLKQSKEVSASVNSFLIESIGSVDTIKGLHIEDFCEEKFLKKYRAYLDESYSLNKAYKKEDTLSNMISELSFVIMLFIATKMFFKDILTIGDVVAFSSLYIYFLEPIKSLINISLSFKNISLALKRINNIFEVGSEDLNVNNNIELNNFDISIDDLGYSYDEVHNVLENVSLKVKKGEKILISGQSGSGKSTLFKILMRYLNNYQGKIYIGGIDLNNLDLKTVRENLVYVSQSEVIYNDTLYNNVTLGRVINYGYFLKIAKISGLEKLEKKSKYNTLIEEGGFNLSGGERQRIMLARSLLKDAKIFIFDESLSQLDVTMEKEILKDVFKTFADKTFIVISHRLANESLFDKVYVLKEAKLCLK